MKRSVKVASVVAGGLIAVGTVFSAVALVVVDGDFSKLNSVRYEKKEYVLTGDFEDISLDVKAAEICFLPSTDGDCKVVCKEAEEVYYNVCVLDGVLQIEERDERKWYDYIGVFELDKKLTVYLPKMSYGDFSLTLSAGEVVMPERFSFKEAQAQVSAGDIEWHADAETLRLKTSAGDVEVGQVCVESLFVTTASGDIDLEKTTASGEMKLKASSGDIELNGCDAASYDIATESGDVEGTLLAAMTFDAAASSGSVRVPKGEGKGVCKVRTRSGDICFKVLSA